MSEHRDDCPANARFGTLVRQCHCAILNAIWPPDPAADPTEEALS